MCLKALFKTINQLKIRGLFPLGVFHTVSPTVNADMLISCVRFFFRRVARGSKSGHDHVSRSVKQSVGQSPINFSHTHDLIIITFKDNTLGELWSSLLSYKFWFTGEGKTTSTHNFGLFVDLIYTYSEM